ncbi:MAG: PBP1A family penicillin-binding protein [Proteobacteria bacterium]|nr:PBP1A family penicillin-binding protein [Pseudomonadota bacterium]MBU4470522.1 PBP1A family penicillin-binding protein [Pseudomonadota bacterium]MCG2751358.1 PBP1A family penicillin-binding protein [Desulfobacteraceae bacterium]
MKKKKRKKRNKNKFRSWIALSALLLLIFSLVTVSIYCFGLSMEIDKRFSGRRWSIPSKVYSDTLLLYPGQQFDQSAILTKLSRLGYRPSSGKPGQMGEYVSTGNTITVFLHNLETPFSKRSGIPVRMVFRNKQIDAILDVTSGQPLPLLELEPEEIMLFFGSDRERRQLVSIAQVPKHVIHAILAAEDTRFFSHRGMDVRGILRAVFINVKSFALKQGGSTITQQLAKNYFLTPERKFTRKIKELFMSITMEFMYEKEEILEIYLNEIYLGQKSGSGINGIGEASFFYFDKPVENLTLAEGAAIAGLIRAPNRYSPYINKELCRQRRNQVLEAMVKNEWLDESQRQKLIATPVEPAVNAIHGSRAPYFMDYLSTQLQALYSPQALESLGLSIYTTLDSDVQKAAEEALEKGLVRLEKSNPALLKTKLQGAVIVMQPRTGYILAMVGGRDYSKSQFNRAVQALRQPGSAFKPFVFTAGLDVYTPASLLSNIPKTYYIDGKPWSPKNYAPFSREYVTMRTALAHSINLATVDLAMNIGMDRIMETAKDFGFTSFDRMYPSGALGGMDVIPLELARAYCAFASDGMLPFPLSMKEVADENGELLDKRHVKITRAVSPEKAFIINSMLQSVVEQGTAESLKFYGITYPVCGKTGTTNDNRDAWFVGFTPDILALVWVGADDGKTIYASGARAALPIWADLISALPQYVSKNSFTKPPGVVKRTFCLQTGQLAVPGKCPNTQEEYFLENHTPSEYCTEHQTTNPLKQVIDDIKNLFKR